jgi:formyltetrahydrofolate deformylase
MPEMNEWIVTVRGQDRTGLVGAVGSALATVGANVTDAEQHCDRPSGLFVQRIECTTASGSSEALREVLESVGSDWHLDVSVHDARWRPAAAILASGPGHVLGDLLLRWRAGELPASVVAVISDVEDHQSLAEWAQVPYIHLPTIGVTREAHEHQVDAVLREVGAERVWLARYMRILTGWFVDRWQGRVINIHHSFLPSFVGAGPYRQAFERGVKLVGATAHYVTEGLDEGPIIAQDVVAVTHRDSVEDLARKGRDLETSVMARAVLADCLHQVVDVGGRTVVFG